MTPSHLALFKDKFPAHLVEIASFQDVPTRSNFLDNGFDRVNQYRGLHVFRALIS